MSPTKNTLACASRACNGVLCANPVWFVPQLTGKAAALSSLRAAACAAGACPQLRLNDARRDENSQFAALVAMRPMAEKRA